MQKKTPRSHFRYTELDGLRGIAILMVVIWHYVVVLLQTGGASAPMSYLSRYLSLAWSGVDLFFVLSGFLIGGILLDNRESSNYFGTFYIRRVCRIFPLYFLSLLLFFVLLSAPASFALFEDAFGWLFGNKLPSWSYLTFTQNFAMAFQGNSGPNWIGVTWSLAVEEQFYLVLPLLVRFVSGKILPYLLAGLIIVVPLLRLAMVDFDPGGGYLASYVLMPFRLDALLLGVLCAWLVRKERFNDFLRRGTNTLYGVLTVLAVVGFSLIIFRSYTMLPPGSRYTTFFPASPEMTLYGYTWLALLYSCILLIAVTEKRGPVAFVTKNRFIGRFGIIAFGVYLFHMPILGSIHGLLLGQPPQLQTWSDLIVTLGALLLTLVAASVSWIFFEKRIVNWGRRYFRYKAAIEPETAVERHP